MRLAFRSRARVAGWLSTLGMALLGIALCGNPATASMAAGRMLHPELIAPAPGAVATEGGLRFAWTPVAGASRHWIVVARAPFETAGLTAIPNDPALTVRALDHPVASLSDLGVVVDRESRFWWAAASQDPASGRVWFSEVRACSVTPRFTNRLAEPPELLASPVAAMPRAVNVASDRIRLTAGYEIDPSRGEPALPEALRGWSGGLGATRAYLVYFGAADPQATRERIQESGGTVIAYLPDHAYLVRMPASRQLALESERSWVGAYQPAYKLSPALESISAGPRVVQILLFPGGDLASVTAAVRDQGGTVVTSSANGINTLVRASLVRSGVLAIAQHPDVMWIEPFAPFQLHNDVAQWVIQTNSNGNRRVWDQGIHGEGQVIMTSDSGVGVTHDMFRDPSVSIATFGDYPTHRKVIGYKRGGISADVTFGDNGSYSYHGTHTAGTACGSDDPTSNLNAYDGMAKAAKLYFMDVGGPLLAPNLDTFPDLNDLYQPSYTGNAGGAARVSSNSWGSAVAGSYDISSMMVDQFIWNHPDYLICFSSGNSGAAGSVGSPATAKNVVSVGGTGNGGAANQIYGSTSRGPAADGRRKPTICAPAVGLRSSTTAPSAYGSLSGTSMASPCVAGAATLIRQYLTEGWYPTGAKVPANAFTPSAALLKSMMVNSGDNDITGFQAPDNNVGFGRIDLDSVLYFGGDQRRLLLVDMTAGLGQAQAIEYQVNVTDGSVPLEVSVCWTDYPGVPVGGRALVNDLNLVVSHGGVTYYGNNYTSGVSNTNLVRDSLNVEEAVRVSPPATGLWTIRVEGAYVPFGPQPFGLTITGGVGANAGAVALDRASYGSTSTVQVRVTDTNAIAVTVRVTSPTEPAGEVLTLSNASGVWTGSLPLSPYLGANGDGTLQVSNGDALTATYDDASPAVTLTAQAQVEFDAPVISGVDATSEGPDQALVEWDTDVNATSRVYYGITPALGLSTAFDPTATLHHQVLIQGLPAGQTDYFDVESQDLNGNVTRDDNGGAHYRFTVRPPGDLLLIYSDDFERPEQYQGSLDRLGWTFDVWRGPATESPRLGDASLGLRSYAAVWWQTGLDHYPPFSDAARDSITAYLNGGGRLAVVGHDVAWSLGDGTSPYYTPARGLWLQNTLRTQFHGDPGGWAKVYGVPGDPISGSADSLDYAEHRAGGSGDEVGAYYNGGAAFSDWVSGDVTRDSCGIRWESATPLGTPGTGRWAGQTSRLATMYFEWSGIDPLLAISARRDSVLRRTLEWLTGRVKPEVAILAPNGGGTVTGDAVSIQWTESSPLAVASRTLEYSADGGQSWTTITGSAGPSPYSWDVTGVPNTSEALVRLRIVDSGTPALSDQDASDAPFGIQRAAGDAMGPVVQAGSVRVNPNPIDAGQGATLTATVSDSTSGGSVVAAAEWSAGVPAAPGTGLAMSGAFGTVRVSATATIAAGTLPVGLRTINVRGRDAAGNWGAARSIDVVVNDPTTPTLLAMFQTEPVADGIEVRWRLAEGVPFTSVELERAAAVTGPWTRLDGERRAEEGAIVVLDREPAAGLTYYYRLVAQVQGGERLVFGPIAATAGRPYREFQLISVRPNPGTGPMWVDFAVPREADVSLSIVDVQGREVATLARGAYRAGRYQATWSGESRLGRTPAGVYFVVFRAPGKNEVRRVVLAR